MREARLRGPFVPFTSPPRELARGEQRDPFAFPYSVPGSRWVMELYLKEGGTIAVSKVKGRELLVLHRVLGLKVDLMVHSTLPK